MFERREILTSFLMKIQDVSNGISFRSIVSYRRSDDVITLICRVTGPVGNSFTSRHDATKLEKKKRFWKSSFCRCVAWLVVVTSRSGNWWWEVTVLYSYDVSNQRDATLHRPFISGKLLYMFRVVSPPFIRSTHNCIYSIWYLLTVMDKNKLLVNCI